uniref:FCH and double SH3 domains protein 2 n=2 Tax=Aceria tosichella TaxID=561515 RepID=A0A6G1S7M9_9ACAR
MSTPQGTPIKHVRLGLVSAKSSPLTNEFKRLLCDQHQRLSVKHQQDLDLIDDIRSYVKARLSIEKDYTNALQKLAKHHSNHIQKKFQLLHQLDREFSDQQNTNTGSSSGSSSNNNNNNSNPGTNQTTGPLDGSNQTNRANTSAANTAGSGSNGLGGGDTQHQGQSQTAAKHQHNNQSEQNPTRPSSLYRVWSDHVNCLQSTARNRADQFEQSNLIVDKLKDIRQHKAAIGKKCLDTHLRRIQEDLLASMLDVDKAKKLYYEDESQAKKARENEERIKKKRSGLLTKFTDLQAKKEKSSAQREATDIQSTQARNDYIMALAAANSHLNYYYYRDLKDFIHLIDDGVLDHCKIFMATLSECDINSLKDSLSHSQYWSKLINLTGSQQTNQIFLDCEQSKCLKYKQELVFEPCNNDPISKISLEHNADYALQHEIDKWFTWFKKECRNLSQLMHQLDVCQQAFADGKKSIEFNGQTIDDLEPKIIDLKQQIRKCEAAKLRAQSRLMVIKEGGMQIEEWSAVELEIRADMARAQEEQERAKRSRQVPESAQMDGRTTGVSFDEPGLVSGASGGSGTVAGGGGAEHQGGGGLAASSSIHLQVSHDTDDSDTQVGESMHNLASVSRSTSNLMQKQQQALTGYSALTDPSLVWQDDYSATWGASSTTGAIGPANTGNQSESYQQQHQESGEHHDQQPMTTTIKSPTSPRPSEFTSGDELASRETPGYDLLGSAARQNDQTQQAQHKQQQQQQQHIPNASMSIQSSSPLSAIVNGGQHLSQSPYQGAMSEAYKSDYECDYTRIGQHSVRSAASSVEPSNQHSNNLNQHQHQTAGPLNSFINNNKLEEPSDSNELANDACKMLNRRVIALYKFEKNNHDDLEFDEHDLLEVIEVNAEDTNWVKARHLANGKEGYIPSSYVRLVHDDDVGLNQGETRRQSSAWSASGGDQQQQQQADEIGANDDLGAGLEPGVSYCRALYDYSPDGDAVDEEDGLPHLSLTQGELCKIIDQGEDDGWWLVEKQESGVRGHVPSMLVEEVEPGDDEDEADRLEDDGDVTEEDELEDEEGEHVFQEPPPSFEPPVLELAGTANGAANDGDHELVSHAANQVEVNRELPDTEVTTKANEITTTCGDGSRHEESADAAADENQTQPQQQVGGSLIPKSFIIIEPTPEVESRRFEDDLEQSVEDSGQQEVQTSEAQGQQEESDNNNMSANHDKHASRQMVQSQPPSSQMGYSVYNEDFVLEKPSRKPNNATAVPDHHAHTPHHHHAHEPTIIEEDDSAAAANQAIDASASSKDSYYRNQGDDQDQEEEFQFDKNRPAPPEVVIDSVEAIPRSPDLSFDEGAGGTTDEQQDDRQSQYSEQSQEGDQQSNTSSSNEQRNKPIRHTGFADVSPILRHHADEFTKQLIEEALMLAPGSRIGPSTSSADILEDSDDERGGGVSEDADDYGNDESSSGRGRNRSQRTFTLMSNHNGNGHAGDDDYDDDEEI